MCSANIAWAARLGSDGRLVWAGCFGLAVSFLSGFGIPHHRTTEAMHNDSGLCKGAHYRLSRLICKTSIPGSNPGGASSLRARSQAKVARRSAKAGSTKGLRASVGKPIFPKNVETNSHAGTAIGIHCARIVPDFAAPRLLRGLDEVALADDVVARTPSASCAPSSCMARRSGTPERTGLRTAP